MERGRAAEDSARLPVSERHWLLVGLNLLRLLSQNRIAEFHTELERLPPASLDNAFVKHPIHVEQWLMEGAYNQVRARPPACPPACPHARTDERIRVAPAHTDTHARASLTDTSRPHGVRGGLRWRRR